MYERSTSFKRVNMQTAWRLDTIGRLLPEKVCLKSSDAMLIDAIVIF